MATPKKDKLSVPKKVLKDWFYDRMTENFQELQDLKKVFNTPEFVAAGLGEAHDWLDKLRWIEDCMNLDDLPDYDDVINAYLKKATRYYGDMDESWAKLQPLRDLAASLKK